MRGQFNGKSCFVANNIERWRVDYGAETRSIGSQTREMHSLTWHFNDVEAVYVIKGVHQTLLTPPFTASIIGGQKQPTYQHNKR